MASQNWTEQTKWIWIPNYNDSHPQSPGQFALFRKSFNLSSLTSEKCFIHVSADSRYRLFINGASVAFGPCKSYLEKWYYETVDIGPYLCEGKNVLSAKVLRYSATQTANFSLMRANIPGLVVHGKVQSKDLSTDESWRCILDESSRIVPASEWNYMLGPPLLLNNETVDGSKAEANWQSIDFDDSHWSSAVFQSARAKMLPVLDPWKLTGRPIPMFSEIPRNFDSTVRSGGDVGIKSWNDLIRTNAPVHIGPLQTVFAELQVLAFTTGFLELHLSGGIGTKIRIICAECYEQDLGVDRSPWPLPRSKGNRVYHENSRLYGLEDTYIVNSESGDVCYEPFWFRAFRFVRLEITCHNAPITIKRFAYREFHYPLEISTKISLSPILDDMWKISLNTLRNCMHETYEDCPFYEQNQFIADSRLQMLFTYQLSHDDRLARKTIQEFNASRRPDGLLEAQFPNPFRAVNIPQFSLYWIWMIHDHMRYFNDGSLIRAYIGTVDGILHYFHSRVNEKGLVGKFDSEMWPFIDWVDEWKDTRDFKNMALPASYQKEGVATFNSLLYAMTLNAAADLCDYISWPDVAAEYRKRSSSLNEVVNKYCFVDGFYTDGTVGSSKSQHCQVFAVLSGAITGDAARELVLRTFQATNLPKCSYALGFYVFEAVAKVGLLEDMFQTLIQPWTKMMENNLTTWAEDSVNSRSDCHGWSACLVHVFVAHIFGLTPATPSYKYLRIDPLRSLLSSAKGSFATTLGNLSIEWSKDKGILLSSTTDMGVEVVVHGSTQHCRLIGGQVYSF
ncbi:carbohydrate-binding module family 67 protein [Glonium stellatum]|uniref:Carbohydrate-binding module family 67 protein n=1 Tax=Glonium stellatum TaxID=574774 RepID=A0A8E2EYR4_9PEZI|nr:carbohydrate-binding module family 67 protein [Glonium stellatum]